LIRLLLILLLVATPAWSAPDEKDDEAEGKKKKRKKTITETVVVSASATTQALLDSPTAVSVIDGEALETGSGEQLTDHLRRVPGINVVQFSSRDVNISSRGATGGINNSTLALADGRSIYQDFLGFILWEFAPTDFSLVDRVEVVRGPSSSLWGANAVGGLVHIITKSPAETLGGRLSITSGSYASRRIDAQHSFLVGDWALRIKGSFFEADAFRRPQTITNLFGEVVDPDLGLIEDGFRDSGTDQPSLDLRADWESESGARWILQGGWGRTRGWIATGLGPFDIDPGTSNSYVQGRYQYGPYEAQIDASWFDGGALNLINAIPFGFRSGKVHSAFRGKTLLGSRGILAWGSEVQRTRYELSIAPDGKVRTQFSIFAETDLRLHDRVWLDAGARIDHFTETIGTVLSPRAALRFKPNETQTIRLAWGQAFRSPSVIESDLLVPTIPVAIIDWAELDAEVIDPNLFPFGFFEPIAAVVCQSQPDNCGAPPGEVPDYIAVTSALGSRELKEESTRSIEIGYAAQLGDFDLSAAVYRTNSEEGIDFPQKGSYGLGVDGLFGTLDDVILPTDPDGNGIDEAPAVDVCPYLNALPPFNQLCPQFGAVTYNEALSILLDGEIPSLFQYDNGATARNWGIELGTHWNGPNGLSLGLNYSWQSIPRADGIPMDRRIDTVIAEDAAGMDLDGDGLVADTASFVNIPAENRIAFSARLDRAQWYTSLNIDHVGETFWQDVLTSDFWGYVPDYTLVGLKGGYRFRRSPLEITAQVSNLLDDDIQQHIFGDIVDRRASIALHYAWGGVAETSQGK